MTLNLKAENKTEEKVLAFLTENASEALAAKINAGNKTLAGAMAYAHKEARKLANGTNSIYVEPETVFGWIIHYFEEPTILEEAPRPKRQPVTAGHVVQRKPEPQKPPVQQLDLFGNLA